MIRLPIKSKDDRAKLIGREGIQMLRGMNEAEALAFVRRAADIAEETDNLAQGLRQSLLVHKGSFWKWRAR